VTALGGSPVPGDRLSPAPSRRRSSEGSARAPRRPAGRAAQAPCTGAARRTGRDVVDTRGHTLQQHDDLALIDDLPVPAVQRAAAREDRAAGDQAAIEEGWTSARRRLPRPAW
jgi:hypothetical protein